MYVDVYIPKRARAGTYSGTVAVEAGPDKAVLSVQLRVYDFALPDTRPQARWQVEIDSYDLASPPEVRDDERKPGDTVTAGPRSVVVLRSGHPG